MYDLLVIGGGINGVGIARDAAGRGLKVVLVEKDDLASHTSSSSTKLIHGGLRYLENYDFALVRKALGEREILLKAAPHIIWPLRFVLPVVDGMRPAWLLRLGLFLYDHLGKRQLLPGSDTLRLRNVKEGAPLRRDFRNGFIYSDCWVDDARLVILNALDCAARGGEIRTRTACTGLKRMEDHWIVTLDGTAQVQARVVVNAAGPFVDRVIGLYRDHEPPRHVRLVKGSHIVLPRLYDGDWAYMFQNDDGRIVFAIPFEDAFTLIGTTETPVAGPEEGRTISDEERAYLCMSVNRFFLKDIAPEDIVWSYAGIRPLYEDHAGEDSTVTRDFVLDLDTRGGAPILSVFGGKITTYRELAGSVMTKIGSILPDVGEEWTEDAPLPGGNFAVADRLSHIAALCEQYGGLPPSLLERLFRCYGTRTGELLGDAKAVQDLGRDFGGGMTEGEAHFLVDREYACAPDDILWRRTKCGLHMSASQRAAFADWFQTARVSP